ncbi:hypothetical protein FHT85_003769 [Rhizobium sp. BK312]|nr:hypothetical protein [Rhizobium sp. BK312]
MQQHRDLRRLLRFTDGEMNKSVPFTLLIFINIDHEYLLKRLVERQVLILWPRQGQHGCAMLGDDGYKQISLARKQPIEGLLRNPTSRGNQIHGCASISEFVEDRSRLSDDLSAALIVAHGFRTTARAARGSLVGLGCSFLCQHTELTPTTEYD